MKLFNCPVHLACGSDKLRPVFDYVYFRNGYIWATNSYIAIRISYNSMGLNIENSKLLEEKQIHKDVFKFIYNHPISNIIDNKIECVKGNVKTLIEIDNFKDDKLVTDIKNLFIDNINAFVDSKKEVDYQFAINPNYLNRLNCIINQNDKVGIILSRRIIENIKTKPLLITSNLYDYKDRIGLLMPIFLDDFTEFKKIEEKKEEVEPEVKKMVKPKIKKDEFIVSLNKLGYKKGATLYRKDLNYKLLILGKLKKEENGNITAPVKYITGKWKNKEVLEFLIYPRNGRDPYDSVGLRVIKKKKK